MLKISIEEEEALKELQRLRARLREAKLHGVEVTMKRLSKLGTTFLGQGVEGFRPSPGGKTLTQGLEYVVHEKKRRGSVFGTAWNNMINMFQNFKERKRVNILGRFQRYIKMSGLRDFLGNEIMLKLGGTPE